MELSEIIEFVISILCGIVYAFFVLKFYLDCKKRKFKSKNIQHLWYLAIFTIIGMFPYYKLVYKKEETDL